MDYAGEASSIRAQDQDASNQSGGPAKSLSRLEIFISARPALARQTNGASSARTSGFSNGLQEHVLLCPRSMGMPSCE